MRDRALTLREDPLRCQSLPHMLTAEWDLLELLMVSLSQSYPDLFTLTQEGDRWHWINRRSASIRPSSSATSPPCRNGPWKYITRQVQGDFCLLDQRNGDLFVDSGMVTSQADWSLDFDIGMSFKEWHAPVPFAHEMGIFERAQKFLLALPMGRPCGGSTGP